MTLGDKETGIIAIYFNPVYEVSYFYVIGGEFVGGKLLDTGTHVGFMHLR
jgi:hypothetical protein